jgi:hypothetical protein
LNGLADEVQIGKNFKEIIERMDKEGYKSRESTRLSAKIAGKKTLAIQ